MTDGRPIVAVVDDDPRLLQSLENLLESGEYAVRSFSSARSLLVGGLSNLDMVITDIGMPDMDGFELCGAVKKVRSDLPMFLITGRHEIGDADHARCADGFFRKPFDGQLILAAVGSELNRSKNGGDHES